jgi:hypothetical protein
MAFFLSNKELLQVPQKKSPQSPPSIPTKYSFPKALGETSPKNILEGTFKFANTSKRRHIYTFSLGVGGRERGRDLTPIIRHKIPPMIKE